MEFFSGLDVSMERTAICVVDDKGEVQMQTEVVTDPNAIAAALKPFLPRLRRAGHEAGSLSPWLLDEGPSRRKVRRHRRNRSTVQAQRRSRPPPVAVRLSRAGCLRGNRGRSPAALLNRQASVAGHSMRLAGPTRGIRVRALNVRRMWRLAARTEND